MQFSRFQCNAEHLSSSLRQFVGLIHYDGAAIRQNGTFPTPSVNGVGQKEVVITNLDGISL